MTATRESIVLEDNSVLVCDFHYNLNSPVLYIMDWDNTGLYLDEITLEDLRVIYRRLKTRKVRVKVWSLLRFCETYTQG